MRRRYEPLEISFQLVPPRLIARGWWAVVPTALAVSFVLLSYGVRAIVH